MGCNTRKYEWKDHNDCHYDYNFVSHKECHCVVHNDSECVDR